MRGTLHMVVRDDLGWMLPLFGPTFIKKTKRRYQQLGLNENDCLRAVDRIAEILLAHGGMTRLELAKELAREGIPESYGPVITSRDQGLTIGAKFYATEGRLVAAEHVAHLAGP